MLVADGGFHASGMFRVAPKLDGVQIVALFRQRVLRLLLSEGRVLPFRQGLELAVECLAADAQNPGGPGAASADELEHGQDMLALHLL